MDEQVIPQLDSGEIFLSLAELSMPLFRDKGVKVMNPLFPVGKPRQTLHRVIPKGERHQL